MGRFNSYAEVLTALVQHLVPLWQPAAMRRTIVGQSRQSKDFFRPTSPRYFSLPLEPTSRFDYLEVQSLTTYKFSCLQA